MEKEDQIVFVSPQEFIKTASERKERERQIGKLSQSINSELLTLKKRGTILTDKITFTIFNSERVVEDNNEPFFSEEIVKSVITLLEKAGWKVGYEMKCDYSSGDNYSRPTTMHRIRFVLEVAT